jgi:hypothetical protein
MLHEIGTIEPIAELVKIAKKKNPRVIFIPTPAGPSYLDLDS